MALDEDIETLDRHALVLTIWLTAGLIAATLFHFGAGAGGSAFIFAAFAIVAAAFVGHVIVNVVLGRDFGARELALGLVFYAVALLAFGVATLLSPDFAARAFWATSLGFVGLSAIFVVYLVTKSGARSAFESFDVIRSFRAGRAPRRETGA